VLSALVLLALTVGLFLIPATNSATGYQIVSTAAAKAIEEYSPDRHPLRRFRITIR
jgi:hypothetical protein